VFGIGAPALPVIHQGAEGHSGRSRYSLNFLQGRVEDSRWLMTARILRQGGTVCVRWRIYLGLHRTASPGHREHTAGAVDSERRALSHLSHQSPKTCYLRHSTAPVFVFRWRPDVPPDVVS
jgi:hypothetical protein